ncbi:hypothetical protein H6G54_02905 [Anabaena cylindrica FACHB-243]|uniref:Uncharacterized protein n=1 Tax=Anabaena cylindrica (strain ATCC 27899 / PCC 7122) TaxID=272123 RepID=K9ZQ17_ANACC|nr:MULTISPECIES: hypothetical protein [Anabaena]AFZ61256.1 hypothetical protein Anacy_5973 [Anabaena cylindrica PCC 7122]MBD2416673.1 hypothetical protein [Anabaena cylindrica FACHB-243]MBY5284610.1 hypothetical protein [Anabaena sp. CCAP 1446/1C]MBY5308422.1 hypothetical protein [Anabaena sp. CCAP 1446/1C]MCM2408694.1 hypothetical protein [Anabaena sp. CCAP 1446/1C]
MDKYLFEQNRTSARKPTDIKETPEGFLAIEFTESKLISSSQQQQNSIISWIIALPLILIFGYLFAVALLAFGSILLLIFIVAFSFNRSYRNHIFAQFRIFPGEVFLSTYPLSLGEKCLLTFRRRLKRNKKTKESGQLALKIICLERVEYKKGTDTEVEINILWESQPEVYSVPTNTEVFSLQTNLNIPKYLPPSFEGKNNQIRWIISIEQNIPNIAEQVHSNFVFIVAPVVLA